MPFQIAGVPKNPFEFRFEAAKRRHVSNTGNPEPRSGSDGREDVSAFFCHSNIWGQRSLADTFVS